MVSQPFFKDRFELVDSLYLRYCSSTSAHLPHPPCLGRINMPADIYYLDNRCHQTRRSYMYIFLKLLKDKITHSIH